MDQQKEEGSVVPTSNSKNTLSSYDDDDAGTMTKNDASSINTDTAVHTIDGDDSWNWKQAIANVNLDDCIQSNEPSPSELLRKVRSLLHKKVSLTEPKANEVLLSICSNPWLQPVEELSSRRVAAVVESSEAALRRIQLQIGLRLELWARFGDTFVSQYYHYAFNHQQHLNKKKKTKQCSDKRKKKKSRISTCRGALLRDVLSIFSLAAFRLPQDKPFSLFLKECINLTLWNDKDSDNSVSSLLPKETLQKIFDHFEVRNPYKNSSLEDEKTKAHLPPRPPPPRRKSKIITSTASTACGDTSVDNKPMSDSTARPECRTDNAITGRMKRKPNTQTSTNDRMPSCGDGAVGRPSCINSLLLPKSGVIRLTAPTTLSNRNSLLVGKDGSTLSRRSRFVGSHFNTNLSNMSTLFRQVKVVNKNQQQAPRQLQRRSSNNSSKNTDLLATALAQQQQQGRSFNIKKNSNNNKSGGATKVNATTAVSGRGNSNIKRRVVVHESPHPVQRKENLRQRQGRSPVNSSNNKRQAKSSLVLETPQQHPSKKRKTAATVIDNTSCSSNQHPQQQHRQGHNASNPMSNASLVAQAFRAVSRKH